MERTCMVAALTVVLFSLACGGKKPKEETSAAGSPAGRADSKQVAFTEADLEKR